MTNWFFFLSTLAVVSCRPQINPQETPSVEIEKQHVIEITPSNRQLFEDSSGDKVKELEENTKEILEKIALVNEQQGLNKKKPRPHYQHFPFSYLRSQDANQRSDFKFPRNPFINPILDYIEKKDQGLHRTSSLEENEAPPGQYIKRKIIHQQTMIVPGFIPNQSLPPPQAAIPQSFYTMNKPSNFPIKQNELEKQTINNIKNIVENSQYGSSFNPYFYPPPMESPYQFYGPYMSYETFPSAKQQQWQWPLAQYFPIVIKDPLMHMFNAMTTMIEYGPQADQANSCAKHSEDSSMKARDISKEKSENLKSVNPSSKSRNISQEKKLSYNIIDNGKGAEIVVNNEDDSNTTTVLDIEDLQITDNREDSVKMNLNFRKSKENQEITKTIFLNNTLSPLDNPLIQTLQITKTEINSNDTSRQSPPIRDQELGEDELEDELDKAEDVQVSHDGNKKLFSKDNTGSGIFVHKIKVRKGGVAIAGPGGIATAGSGGTAIVGPNGFAYTHPDSLAIAGSGTKVVAVEPTINLSQVVMDHKNKTRGQGHAAPSRLGKVVAVGPVIYYNKGKWEEHKPKITLIPFYGGGLGQSLQVVEMPDGTVFTSIIKTPPKKHHASTEEPEVTELENPPLPSKQDIDFGSNLKNIHETAINIIKLQEIAKKNGQLSAEQEETYQKNIEELNTSARNLAELQQQEDEFSENREGLTEWFERKKSTKKDKDKKKKEEEDKKKEEEDKKRKEEEKEEEEETDEENEETDGIAIGLPPPDASVAEAKPVGLAVAGEGGVAASKPIATAVVGPGGLAIARPVGTAIAGVAPDQALVPIYAEGYVGGTKPKRYNSSNKGDATSEFLNKIISKYHQV